MWVKLNQLCLLSKDDSIRQIGRQIGLSPKGCTFCVFGPGNEAIPVYADKTLYRIIQPLEFECGGESMPQLTINE